MVAKQVQAVAVIGAGTMGAGIAGVFARAGHRVCLVDINEERLQQGMSMLDAAQGTLVEANLLSGGEAAAARGRVLPTLSLETACRQAQLLIEAVSEDMAVKRDMFARFDDLCPPDTLLASNTSGLSITEIAAATGRPTHVAGMHFWNPPHVIPLVEITQGERTSTETAERLMQLCDRIGKQAILVRHDIPGFVGNRLQFAVLREALHLLASGIASAADIDKAMTAGPGLRYGLLGPLRTADLGGLDVFLAISKYLFADLSAASGPPTLLSDVVERGRLGAKAGAGFYDYDSDAEVHRIGARRDRVLLAFLEVLKAQPTG